MLYIKTGIPELTVPSKSSAFNLPLKLMGNCSISKIAIMPTDDKSTRINELGNTPKVGTMMRMKRKLAPQMAERLISRIKSVVFKKIP